MTPMPQDKTTHSNIPFLIRLIATGLYSGYSPFASGTAGSAVAVALYLMIPSMEFSFILLVISAITFFVGVVASAKVEAVLGEDPSIVVIDEIVGMWVSLLFFPKSITLAVIAFVLFRIFDIIKPSPARESERLRNGWGIMLDDLIAGIYANITLRAILFVFPSIANV